ncbi:MAG TPA: hypothetical protein VFV65_03800 [Gemmatimonadales bacterium]|nr:hypothetical protein [Gemmatimonadales bacterium]
MIRASAIGTSLLAALVVSAGPLRAQGEFGLFGGVLVPTSNVTLPASSSPPVFANQPAKTSTAFTYGALGRWWFGERVGVQATVGHSDGSLVLYSTGSGLDSTVDASSTVVTATLTYRLSEPYLSNAVWLNAGVVWVSEGGPFYDQFDGTSSTGVTFGAGSTLPLGERFRVNLALDAFLYSLNLTGPGLDPGSSNQFDLRATAGMVIAVGH